MKKFDPKDSLARQLRWLMFFRVATNTFLLGTTIVVQFRKAGEVSDEALAALYGLIGAIYVMTFIYALILPRLAPEKTQAFIQIIFDLFINTGVIYLTGGLESAFSFMYILTIINAGILLKIRGAVIAASLSAILYGGLLDLHYYRYIDPYLTHYSYLEHYRALDILNTILINMGAFYLVAFLSGYLSKQAEASRLELAERQSDLERLEDLNESIIQSIDAGLMTLGAKGHILSFNPAAERITGLRFHELRGRPHTAVFPDLTLPEPGAEQGRTPSWNWIYKRNDGNELNLEMDLLGLRDRSGDHWLRLMVFQDKTHIQRMEDEVKRIEKLAFVGELAAGIAHEIRNPLASISGSFQMLEEDIQGGSEQMLLMGIIRRELDRLNRIVNDFLLFARPRTGEHVPMDLSKTIEDNLRMFLQQADLDQRIDIVKGILAGVWVVFDRHQIEQVMWNLLRNAAEAMPEGGRLTVNVGVSESEPKMGVVAVSDTGKGISPDDRLKIFDPFFTTKDSGSGLGLSIVFRILESANGRIEVASLPGSGTTFTIYLPLADRTDTTKKPRFRVRRSTLS